MTQPRSTIVFDIEVAGFPWEEVDESTRGYLLERESDPTRRDGVRDRLALYPGLGKVIAIGLWLMEKDRGMILLEGKEQEEHPWEKVPHSKIYRGSEAQILQRFWQIVGARDAMGRSSRLVTFNGRGYDGPVLMVRSAQMDIAPSRQLVPYRYDLTDHCDLFDVLTFQGSTRDRYSLDYWCRRFDVESPKSSIDGSQVGRAYREGRIDDIGEYCLRDVRATGQLYSRLARTLLPLFKGGS
ncbi:MAG: ribonuclease H-like domain-containing protein [Planctomycetes bacterium]|nr:ribonuclease H-like domain-containing protein [Planctomycetota bacterium]MCB9908885.1 ribonuclease H-like domain-containing protein [Planctomycetota bacterium]HPF13136.1 ribonuclease H-like domain-containing protein [Planctomycetota bacterium]HRV82370.1 ribonuclease H-like domain-containing protein [Planctomycetota bacterium]